MEIMKPIAAPSIGGMVTSSLHVLFMTPCLFVIGEDIRRVVGDAARGRSGGLSGVAVDVRPEGRRYEFVVAGA